MYLCRHVEQPVLARCARSVSNCKTPPRSAKTLDQRIRRLRAAEAALYGGRSPNAKVLNREALRDYLAEHPGSRSLEVADGLGVPAGSVRTLLSHDEAIGRSQ